MGRECINEYISWYLIEMFEHYKGSLMKKIGKLIKYNKELFNLNNIYLSGFCEYLLLQRIEEEYPISHCCIYEVWSNNLK